MTEKPVVGRVKQILGRSAVDSETTLHPVIAQQANPATAGNAVPVALPDEALQVLTLAQRTADEHITAAERRARVLHAEAKAEAEKIAKEAREHAAKVLAEADDILTAARDAANITRQEAHSQATKTRRQAEQALAEARAEAERITAGGKQSAEQLRMQAETRYQDTVGGLATKREALQKQIDSLEEFDAEYRRRLTDFMQHQLRALWADKPETTDVPAEEKPKRVTGAR